MLGRQAFEDPFVGFYDGEGGLEEPYSIAAPESGPRRPTLVEA
jgi:hypothetical protein